MPIVEEPMNGDVNGSVRDRVNDVEDAAGIVELVGPSSITTVDSDTAESSIDIPDDQIAPLLTQSERPKINIFTIAYPRQKLNKEEVIRVVEPDKSSLLQFIFWLWNGSRYSGLLCVVLSSTIYSTMEVVSDVFTAQAVPLFETAFARCTVVLILSFVWLRRSGQPIFGPTSARKLLVLRALGGCISLLSFIYSIQRLPVSQAIILSFIAPIIASTVARVTLHEKLKIAEIGGLASSFFGVLFIFQPMVKTQVLMRPPALVSKDLGEQGPGRALPLLDFQDVNPRPPVVAILISILDLFKERTLGVCARINFGKNALLQL